MKKALMLLFLVLCISFSEAADAGLTTIGTASYGGQSYNLIFEGTLGNQGLVWLDYTRGFDWENHIAWASSLGGSLNVTLYPGYTSTIQWDTGWRLPSTDEGKANLSGGWGYAGPDGTGYHNYGWGYNMVNSEMGHLFYESLGNKAYYANDGTNPQPGWGLLNKGDFSNLRSFYYWSGTEYSIDPNLAWAFSFRSGFQDIGGKEYSSYALAVRPGEVSAVPIPGAIWLLGSGIAGLVAFRRRSRA